MASTTSTPAMITSDSVRIPTLVPGLAGNTMPKLGQIENTLVYSDVTGLLVAGHLFNPENPLDPVLDPVLLDTPLQYPLVAADPSGGINKIPGVTYSPYDIIAPGNPGPTLTLPVIVDITGELHTPPDRTYIGLSPLPEYIGNYIQTSAGSTGSSVATAITGAITGGITGFLGGSITGGLSGQFGFASDIPTPTIKPSITVKPNVTFDTASTKFKGPVTIGDYINGSGLFDQYSSTQINGKFTVGVPDPENPPIALYGPITIGEAYYPEPINATCTTVGYSVNQSFAVGGIAGTQGIMTYKPYTSSSSTSSNTSASTTTTITTTVGSTLSVGSTFSYQDSGSTVTSTTTGNGTSATTSSSTSTTPAHLNVTGTISANNGSFNNTLSTLGSIYVTNGDINANGTQLLSIYNDTSTSSTIDAYTQGVRYNTLKLNMQGSVTANSFSAANGSFTTLTVNGTQQTIVGKTVALEQGVVEMCTNNTADTQVMGWAGQYIPSGATSTSYSGIVRMPTSAVASEYPGQLVCFQSATDPGLANSTTNWSFTLEDMVMRNLTTSGSHSLLGGLYITNGTWSGGEDGAHSNICNDTNSFNCLMILGNSSSGNGRQVHVWDDLTVDRNLFVNGYSKVNGNQYVTGSMYINNNNKGFNSTLASLVDVSTSNPVAGQILSFNPGTSQWTNSTLPSIPTNSSFSLSGLNDVSETLPARSGDMLMYSVSRGKWTNYPLRLDNCLDVNIQGSAQSYGGDINAASGQFLGFNGSQWTNTLPSLSGLSDVTVSSASPGQVMAWNGSKWTNTTTSLNGGPVSTSQLTLLSNNGPPAVLNATTTSTNTTYTYSGTTPNGTQYTTTQTCTPATWTVPADYIVGAEQSFQCVFNGTCYNSVPNSALHVQYSMNGVTLNGTCAVNATPTNTTSPSYPYNIATSTSNSYPLTSSQYIYPNGGVNSSGSTIHTVTLPSNYVAGWATGLTLNYNVTTTATTAKLAQTNTANGPVSGVSVGGKQVGTLMQVTIPSDYVNGSSLGVDAYYTGNYYCSNGSSDSCLFTVYVSGSFNTQYTGQPTFTYSSSTTSFSYHVQVPANVINGWNLQPGQTLTMQYQSGVNTFFTSIGGSFTFNYNAPNPPIQLTLSVAQTGQSSTYYISDTSHYANDGSSVISWNVPINTFNSLSLTGNSQFDIGLMITTAGGGLHVTGSSYTFNYNLPGPVPAASSFSYNFYVSKAQINYMNLQPGQAVSVNAMLTDGSSSYIQNITGAVTFVYGVGSSYLNTSTGLTIPYPAANTSNFGLKVGTAFFNVGNNPDCYGLGVGMPSGSTVNPFGVEINSLPIFWVDTNRVVHTRNNVLDDNAGNMNISGVINLTNGSNPLLSFGSNGVAAPCFNSRSVGTKIVLYPNSNSTSVDFGIGVDSSIIWNSVPQSTSTYQFKWYGGTTNIMTVNGLGQFSTLGSIVSSATITSAGLYYAQFNGNAQWQFGTDGSGNFIVFTAGGTTGVYMPHGGSNWVSNSDRRLKTNIVDHPYSCLDKLMQLHPKTYHYTAQEQKDEKHLRHGLIAQDVLEVFPEAVSKAASGFYGVQYDVFTTVTIKAVQELNNKLSAENQQLRDEVNVLKGQMKLIMSKMGLM